MEVVVGAVVVVVGAVVVVVGAVVVVVGAAVVVVVGAVVVVVLDDVDEVVVVAGTEVFVGEESSSLRSANQMSTPAAITIAATSATSPAVAQPDRPGSPGGGPPATAPPAVAAPAPPPAAAASTTGMARVGSPTGPSTAGTATVGSPPPPATGGVPAGSVGSTGSGGFGPWDWSLTRPMLGADRRGCRDELEPHGLPLGLLVHPPLVGQLGDDAQAAPGDGLR